MRSRIQAIVLPSSEASDFTEELRQVFAELSRHTGLGALSGECQPPVDVFETDDSVEIAMDLPGVEASAVRVIAKGQALLIAGEKSPRRGRGESSFHLVERGFGRFARAIRLNASCDPAGARAVFQQGELKISLPKLRDRRNQSIPIAISTGRPDA